MLHCFFRSFSFKEDRVRCGRWGGEGEESSAWFALALPSFTCEVEHENSALPLPQSLYPALNLRPPQLLACHDSQPLLETVPQPPIWAVPSFPHSQASSPPAQTHPDLRLTGARQTEWQSRCFACSVRACVRACVLRDRPVVTTPGHLLHGSPCASHLMLHYYYLCLM